MIVYKISWKSYIADLYVPDKKGNKVVILLPGLPKSSNIESIVKTFLASGCVVIYPNFSGTFDSGGLFSGAQSIKDVKVFIEWAQKTEVTEIYFNKKIKLGAKNKIILAGMSFGAYIVLNGCNDKIDKLLLMSPVLLFNQAEINKIINFDFKSQTDSLVLFLIKAFSYTYRIKSENNLREFVYGNSKNQSQEYIQTLLSSLKIPTLCIHGKIDTSVPWNISNALGQSVKNTMIEWKFPKVGHSTSSYNKGVINSITEFIKES